MLCAFLAPPWLHLLFLKVNKRFWCQDSDGSHCFGYFTSSAASERMAKKLQVEEEHEALVGEARNTPAMMNDDDVDGTQQWDDD